MPLYCVHPTSHAPEPTATWDDPVWEPAPPLPIAHFRAEGSDHRPVVAARLLYDAEALFGIFRVEDRFVRCVRTRYSEPVYKDSCVELFLEPPGGRGYFNFEWNAGGTLLASHVVDPARTPTGLRDARPLAEEEARQVLVRTSLPRVIDPEVRDPLTWTLSFALPFRLMEPYVGPARPSAGDRWRANLYKCADDSSHPHWASWAPLDERNFHLPRSFGVLRFG
jgi:hypothetical protein